MPGTPLFQSEAITHVHTHTTREHVTRAPTTRPRSRQGANQANRVLACCGVCCSPTFATHTTRTPMKTDHTEPRFTQANRSNSMKNLIRRLRTFRVARQQRGATRVAAFWWRSPCPPACVQRKTPPPYPLSRLMTAACCNRGGYICCL